MENQYFLPEILTPFNYVDWREDMQVSLRNLVLHKMTMGRETQSHHSTKKNKFWNWFNEASGFLCDHISRGLLFHPKGLQTPK